ncbi:MAG: nitrogenase component 1 [Myxococcota bacterium]|nr:nitrogenase component 1 [Myxococcota bacterium]
MSAVRDRQRRTLERLAGRLEAEAGEEDFSMRVAYPYLLGVYLGVNAVRDAFLVVEGPDCSYMKAQYIQGNHDWLSTLTSVSGYHRIANTALHPSMMTASREEPVRDMLRRVASRAATGGLLLTTMPMATITGADYDRLCREVARETGKDVVHVPGLSLSGDWLDGYDRTLRALARTLDLSGGEPGPRRVAIVGYLHDRNEEDHAANLRVLGEMCTALDLDLVSVWLSGGRFGDLRAVRDAATILSLPYGRAAARLVARRTGAEVVDLPLPFGLRACEEWMRVLGERFGAADRARAYVDRSLAAVIPRLEWLIPFLFQNRDVGYVGDPHLLPGFRDIVEMLGARLRLAVITNRPAHVAAAQGALDGVASLAWPKLKAYVRFLCRQLLDGDLHLLVANNYGMSIPLLDTAVVEFGFPSVYAHALYDRPFLGFPGFLAFVDTLVNALRQNELTRARAAALEAADS